MAFDLLRERDPRKDVGLEAWGELLETKHGHELAAQMLAKNFGARELTPDWFKARLFSPNDATFQFVKKTLPQVHAPEKLGAAFWTDVLDKLASSGTANYTLANFALAELARLSRGGLVLSVPREPIWRVANMARGKYIGALGNTPGHIQHWSRRSFAELVGSQFDVVGVRSPFPWTMVAARSRT